MPRKKRKTKNKKRLYNDNNEIEEHPTINNDNSIEKKRNIIENKSMKNEQKKEETSIKNNKKDEKDILNEEISKMNVNHNNLKNGNNIKINNKLENIINVKDENIKSEKVIEKDLLLNSDNLKNINNNSYGPNINNENESEKEEISIKNNLKDKIKVNVSQNNEEKKNLLKIANIEYERFIKETERLFQYLKKVNIPIVIKSSLFKQKDIKLRNYSLLKIIKQSSLENDFKIFLTTQIIIETVQFETSSNKSITFNQNIEKFIKNKNYLNLYFQKNKNNNLTKRESFIKIFTLIGFDYFKVIYNYMQFTIIQISYEFNKTKKVYILKGIKSLKKLMEQKTLFYINNNNKRIYDELIPLSNYSIQKIFNLNNGGKDTKYLLLNYEIKNKDFIDYEQRNHDYLDKLINVSDVKNMLIKYKIALKRNPKIVIKQEKLRTFDELDIFDLDIYLSNIINTLLK